MLKWNKQITFSVCYSLTSIPVKLPVQLPVTIKIFSSLLSFYLFCAKINWFNQQRQPHTLTQGKTHLYFFPHSLHSFILFLFLSYLHSPEALNLWDYFRFILSSLSLSFTLSCLPSIYFDSFFYYSMSTLHFHFNFFLFPFFLPLFLCPLLGKTCSLKNLRENLKFSWES